MTRRIAAGIAKARWLAAAPCARLASRTLDLAIAGAAILAVLPLGTARALWAFTTTGRVFDTEPQVGDAHHSFQRISFAGSGPGAQLPGLLNVLRGDLAIAGPRALTPTGAHTVPISDRIRFDARPGLVSPFQLQRSMGIAYETESTSDRNFVLGRTIGNDLALILRSVLAAAIGGSERSASKHLHLFGVRIDNMSMDSAIEALIDAASTGNSLRAAFVNADCMNKSARQLDYRASLNAADLVLGDGIGIRVAARILGKQVEANVNGTDLFPLLCERAAEKGLPIFLLGARPGVARAAGDAMRSRYPGLEIAGCRNGYWSKEEEDDVIDGIAASGAAILLVALGAPTQDLWIERHQDRLRVPVGLGVGGLFDFYSGRIPRAPLWLREIGLEWVWRLLQEPSRMWRRYVVGNPLFLLRVLVQRLGLNQGKRTRNTTPSPEASS